MRPPGDNAAILEYRCRFVPAVADPEPPPGHVCSVLQTGDLIVGPDDLWVVIHDEQGARCVATEGEIPEHVTRHIADPVEFYGDAISVVSIVVVYLKSTVHHLDELTSGRAVHPSRRVCFNYVEGKYLIAVPPSRDREYAIWTELTENTPEEYLSATGDRLGGSDPIVEEQRFMNRTAHAKDLPERMPQGAVVTLLSITEQTTLGGGESLEAIFDCSSPGMMLFRHNDHNMVFVHQPSPLTAGPYGDMNIWSDGEWVLKLISTAQ
jgi:hypothetical protein